MEMFNKIVLNIPHSSIYGVLEDCCGWDYNANLINALMKETDWFTDFIFNDKRPNIFSFVFPWSRFVVDVERLENDPLEKCGRGILYTEINGHKRKQLDSYYEKYFLQLRKNYLIDIENELTENTLLIDCHSFNNELAPDVDICIGFNEDWSKPDDETIKGIENIFTTAGYKVAFNRPYSNSLTPKSECKYKSIMIEVNKKLYLRNNKEINVDSNYAPKLTNNIKKVYDFILN